MNEKKLPRKLQKLKSVVKEQGIYGATVFLYQRFLSRFTTETINLDNNQKYQIWLEKNSLKESDLEAYRQDIESWHDLPKFSIIMPVYNVETQWLKKAIDSVKNQIYPHWELCIADDASPSPHIRPLLEHYSQIDSRIKVVFRETNGNISAASNSALKIATGDYIALLDHDDEITIDALYHNAKLINEHPDADFIYSDEDKINIQGIRTDPFFKPDWSPDYFHACMYTCHLGVYRKRLIDLIGGFRSEYDGAQDYDLVLRVVENTSKIYHIPRVLYHWRTIPSSAASGEKAKPWAYQSARKSLEAMIQRSTYPGFLEDSSFPGFFRVRRKIDPKNLVSIVIPSAGKTIETPQGYLQLLENCIDSIKQKSTYKNFEFVVVDGYNIPDATLEKITVSNVRLVRCDQPFNLSMRINLGVQYAQGEFVILLNDDTEVITPDWIESMLEFAQQEEIGAVGAKLLFPNNTIQHSGVAILGGNPGHVFYGLDANHPGYFLSNMVNRNYFAVTGACLMMRRSLYIDLGGFDEEFPLHYNDVNLCLNAHKAGYRNIVTPYAKLYHYESVSKEKSVAPEEWNKLNQRWGQYFQSLGGDPYYNINLSNDAYFSIDLNT